tara:strand:+ start:4228 stop:5580 length:1353 start_codon:yes stop_codon:yes gene_type:complete
MFSGNFGRGFVEGLAKAVDRGVRDDMERMKDDTSRLARVRFERGVREQERYEEDMKNNLDNIKDMSRKVGSADAVQFLIDRHGFAEAQNIANTLYQRKQKSGGVFDIQGALGLEQRKGASVTAKQLAEFVTPAMKIPEVTGGEDVAGGFMRLFGAEPTDEIKRRSDALLSAQGIPTDVKTSTVDMPEAVGGRGIREWELYTLDDPAADAKRLMSVSQQMYTQANETGNKALLEEAYEVRAAADTRLFEAKSLQNSGEIYNEVDVQRSVSGLTAQLAAANGVADKGQYQNGIYTTGTMASEQANALTEAANVVTKVASQARAAGVNASDISVATARAARENRILIFNPSDDPFVSGGTFSYGEADSLITDVSTLFPATVVTPQGGGGASTQQNAASPVNITIGNAVGQYNAAKTASAKAQVQSSLQQTLQQPPYSMSPADAVTEAKKILGI